MRGVLIMDSNGQMESLIRSAQKRVAENAQAATDREFTAALFGWLASKLERRHNSLPTSLTAGGMGAAIGGGIVAVGKVAGWW